MEENVQNNTSIRYINFTPSDSFKHLAWQARNQLYTSAPKFSRISMMFEKQGDHYNGFTTIDTNGRTFVGFSSNENILVTLRDVEGQLKKQIIMERQASYEIRYKKTS